MPQLEHDLEVDYLCGQFVVACICGEWRRPFPALPGECPTATFARIERAHSEHVAEMAGRFVSEAA